MENETKISSPLSATAKTTSSPENGSAALEKFSSLGTKKLIITAVTIVIVATSVAFLFSQKSLLHKGPQKVAAPTTRGGVPVQDFGQKAPDVFIKNIPLPEGSSFSQSYSLAYKEQKQYTVVFDSGRSVQENYNLYSSFLKKEKWYISSSKNDAAVSYLYGVYMTDTINITISQLSSGTSKSQVSITFTKK